MYKLILHNDLDGLSNKTLALFYNLDIDTSVVGNNNSDKFITEFIESKRYMGYTKVFIIDLTINKSTADCILNSDIDNLVFLDHHESSLYLKEYDWASVIVYKDKKLQCGTNLFYNYLIQNNLAKPNSIIEKYVEGVRLFDTGDMLKSSKDIRQKYLPDELNVIFRIHFFNFPDIMKYNLQKGIILNSYQKNIAGKFMTQAESYSKRKAEELYIIDFEGYKTGVLFIEDAINIIPTYNLCQQNNPEIEIFLIINMCKSISLRSNKSNINLSKIAEKYGGGGHGFAAGMPFNMELITKIMKGA